MAETKHNTPSDADRTTLDDEALQRLMREAFRGRTDAPKVDVLGGVQQRLRERSQGKFYGDAWSTERKPPFATYFITSLMMLAIVVIIYAILTPIVVEPIQLTNEPPPVQLIPPAPQK